MSANNGETEYGFGTAHKVTLWANYVGLGEQKYLLNIKSNLFYFAYWSVSTERELNSHHIYTFYDLVKFYDYKEKINDERARSEIAEVLNKYGLYVGMDEDDIQKYHDMVLAITHGKTLANGNLSRKLKNTLKFLIVKLYRLCYPVV